MMSNKTAKATTSKATTSKATTSKATANKNYAAYAASKNYIAYVAYGSNLSVEQMALRCPDAKMIGTGKIRDYKLVFRFHADIEKSKGSYVPVLVWKISKADEKRLDIYEGVSSGYYHQEKVKVLMDKTLMNQVLMNQDYNNDGEGSENGNKDGKGNQSNNAGSNVAGGEDSNGGNVAGSNASEITAMVYVMNEQTDTELPDTYYLQIIEDGYTHFGFDKSVLAKALKTALKAAR